MDSPASSGFPHQHSGFYRNLSAWGIRGQGKGSGSSGFWTAVSWFWSLDPSQWDPSRTIVQERHDPVPANFPSSHSSHFRCSYQMLRGTLQPTGPRSATATSSQPHRLATPSLRCQRAVARSTINSAIARGRRGAGMIINASAEAAPAKPQKQQVWLSRYNPGITCITVSVLKRERVSSHLNHLIHHSTMRACMHAR